MKQHLMVFAPNTDVKTKEYLCDCTACLQLKFDECLQVSDETDQEQTNKYDDEEYNDDVYQNHQIYDFVEIPSFVSLFTGNVNVPLYFVKLVEKGVATEDFKDAYGHPHWRIILQRELFENNQISLIYSD